MIYLEQLNYCAINEDLWLVAITVLFVATEERNFATESCVSLVRYACSSLQKTYDLIKTLSTKVASSVLRVKLK
jgi:hypothetical protein